MTKYLIKRIIRGLLSVIVVVAVVMALVYTLIDRNDIFKSDPMITKKQSNAKVTYKYERWEEYGYLDYYKYSDYIDELYKAGKIDASQRSSLTKIGKTADKDSEEVAKYVDAFYKYCDGLGYTVVRLDEDTAKKKVGGTQVLFAYKDASIFEMMWRFFSNIITVDTIHYVENDEDLVGERGLSFTFYDPAYGGEKFSPAILGNGTKYKYLVYCDDQFPFIHQNIVKIKLGTSFAVNMGVDAFDSMTQSQGTYKKSEIIYPTGLKEESSDDLHSAQFSQTINLNNLFNKERFTDKYASFDSVKSSTSRMGLSFIIGIISSILAYFIGVPMGITMARNKDKALDKIATGYIVFILAVPSLAYIFIFRAIGMSTGLPGRFDIDSTDTAQYVLPIISLALPSIAGLMQWLRRYMIDQMNSDYVKFARSGGLSEREIFNKHILKNAMIPLVHGIPATILGALVGAIITETVYSVPGTGRMLTNAIDVKDNAVIVGLTAFYALLSIISRILGDVLMATVDPRISFTDKAR